MAQNASVAVGAELCPYDAAQTPLYQVAIPVLDTYAALCYVDTDWQAADWQAADCYEFMQAAAMTEGLDRG